MDLTAYRQNATEQARIGDLFSLIPGKGESALDIGARDGYLTARLTQWFSMVTALDLEKPTIDHEAVVCVGGNLLSLPFADASFDLVLCAEVLEHVPSDLLRKAAAEIARVTRGSAIIGVPFKQDTRVGRTTCRACGRKNPPWGHVNQFDENRLRSLFSDLDAVRVSFVGQSGDMTNALAALLMDYAGNPYGTYDQEEACVHCGRKLQAPENRSPLQKLATRAAVLLNRVEVSFHSTHANWIHMLFSTPTAGSRRS